MGIVQACDMDMYMCTQSWCQNMYVPCVYACLHVCIFMHLCMISKDTICPIFLFYSRGPNRRPPRLCCCVGVQVKVSFRGPSAKVSFSVGLHGDIFLLPTVLGFILSNCALSQAGRLAGEVGSMPALCLQPGGKSRKPGR